MKRTLALILSLGVLCAATAAERAPRKSKRKNKRQTEVVEPQRPATPEPVAAPEPEPEPEPEPVVNDLTLELTAEQVDSLVAVWRERQRHDAYTEFFEHYILADTTIVDTTPDSLYQQRLRDLASPIQLPYNSIVKGYINRYTDPRYGTISRILGMSKYYFPLIEDELLKENLPVELRALPIIESALSTTAVSRAGAVGLWQFMPSTGKSYGLEVNSLVDERRDPVRATQAACRYLKKAYEKYGDWPTVMASYNAGMARISNELDKQISDNSFDLYLNDETSRYVFRIMAIKALLENPGDFGYRLEADQLYRNADYRIVEVSGPVDDWAAWAKEQGISYAQLKEENPWIRSRALTNKTGKTYKVKIPKSDSLYRSKQSGSVYNKAWVN